MSGVSRRQDVAECRRPNENIGRLKFAWLRRLKDSARNCSEDLSRKVVFYTSEKLMVWKDGPSSILRPALPKLPCGGTVKASVLNQRSEVGDATCGLPATFGPVVGA